MIDTLLHWLDKLWPAVPLAIVGIGLLVGAALARRDLVQADQLVSITGRITKIWSELDGEMSTGFSWWVKAQCSYTWLGQSYSERPIVLKNAGIPSQTEMEDLLAAHPVGSSITLWLHPDRPHQPMSQKPKPENVYMFAGVGLAFLLIAAYFYGG